VYIEPSLCSAAKLDALAEDVDDFPFPLVTPLGAENDDGGHCDAAGSGCAVVDCFVVVRGRPLYEKEGVESRGSRFIHCNPNPGATPP